MWRSTENISLSRTLFIRWHQLSNGPGLPFAANCPIIIPGNVTSKGGKKEMLTSFSVHVYVLTGVLLPQRVNYLRQLIMSFMLSATFHLLLLLCVSLFATFRKQNTSSQGGAQVPQFMRYCIWALPGEPPRCHT